MAVETVQNEKEKIKVSPQGWLALVIMLCMFSGFFANMEGPLQFLRVLDLNTLIGSFGNIGDTEPTSWAAAAPAPGMVSCLPFRWHPDVSSVWV